MLAVQVTQEGGPAVDVQVQQHHLGRLAASAVRASATEPTPVTCAPPKRDSTREVNAARTIGNASTSKTFMIALFRPAAFQPLLVEPDDIGEGALPLPPGRRGDNSGLPNSLSTRRHAHLPFQNLHRRPQHGGCPFALARHRHEGR